MYRTMLTAKIHNATVTEANLNYIGSITIDEHILDQVGILVNEKVQVVNVNNGARLETYVIKGERKSGAMCLNGAAARLVQPGDKIIIMAYAQMCDELARAYRPKIAIMNEDNTVQVMLPHEPHSSTTEDIKSSS
ncbi:aspartate 1-decarboxylase [Longirhabdus pacifica]|uniref:aspartate 1-decarboxylase n=1 Tax=Longirhabdus pacifica TaxID=2305227 RepID=UPI001008D11A|nr:aspartate 1-decarboxylase [Longirhabdus pacifica]